MKKYLIVLLAMLACLGNKLQSMGLDNLSEEVWKIVVRGTWQRQEEQRRAEREWQQWRAEREQQQQNMLEIQAKKQAIKHQKKNYNNYHCVQIHNNQRNVPIHQPRSNNDNYAAKNRR